MKLESFFEKFELFADAPNAVAKMRELVLQLACSGRIADQDPADQPASELLLEISEARSRFIKEGKGKNRIEGVMINAGDTMEIPSTWTRCMISEVCDLQTGATPSRQESRYFGGDIPWLVSGDINRGEITECEGRITEAGLRNSNCKVIHKNSVLIALNGQGKTRATVALLRIEAALNQSLVAMIPYSPERLLPEYLYWNLRGRYYAIRDITGQDQRRGLNMKLVGQLSLPVPPLAEQKRIVAKVDELMALCDRLEAQQQERDTRHAALARASLARFAEAPTPANVDFLFHKSYTITPADLRKSILTLAVQGELVGGAGDSSSWPAVKMRDVCLQITDGEHATPQRTSSGVPLATAKNVRDGFLDMSSTDWVAPSTAEKCWKRCKPRHDDLLMVCVGATTGRVCLVQNPPDMVLVRSVALIRPNPERIAPTYLNLFLRSPSGQSQIWGNVKQSAQPCLYLGRMSEFDITLPPLAEQRRIVAKVDQLMILVDQLETQLTASRATVEKLMDTVVAELTAQQGKVAA